MTLPQGHVNRSFLHGGNTQSAVNLDYVTPGNANQSHFHDDFLAKELAFDLGVDVALLKQELRALVMK